MGAAHSAIEFEDNYTASDVSARHRIKCTESCTFTQVTKKSLRTADEISISCKVYESNLDTIAFGLVPEQSVSGCQHYMVGDREIYGSIGCHVKRDGVSLIKGDKRFFNGSHAAGNSYVITMRVRHGTLTFLVDGNRVASAELEEMEFHGSYKLGVSMVRSGQEAEVYLDCPVTFKNVWSAGTVRDEVLAVKKSTNFSFYSHQVVSPSDRRRIVANVIRNCGNSFGLGIVPVDCSSLCRNNLVGMKPGMIGCIFKNGQIFVAVNGDVVFAADVNTSDPCLLSMTLEDGQIVFHFDGKKVNCDVLRAVRLKEDFRIAVGMSAAGQLVEMRGDGKYDLIRTDNKQEGGNGTNQLAGKDVGEKDVNNLLEQLIDLVKYETTSSGISEEKQESPFVVGTRDNTSSTSLSTTTATTKSAWTPLATQHIKEAIMGCYIDSEDLEYSGKPMGKGAFGAVYQGKREGHTVAIKTLPWEEDDRQRREIIIGRSLDHPNIATISGWSKKDNSLLIVMPLFKQGSLADRLSVVDKDMFPTPSNGGHFGWTFSFKVTLGLLRAIKYMASRKPDPIVHRDIKPANVLLDSQDEPKLSDFGTARSVNRVSGSLSSTMCGTPLYWAAEQARGQGASTATDVHAVSLIIYEVLCVPRMARDVSTMESLREEIFSGAIPSLDDVPSEIARVLEPAFSADPAKRPTARDMIRNFTGFTSMYHST